MAINPSVREVKVTATMYDKATKAAVATFTQDNNIKEFTIQRTGEKNKFFGFGITGKLSLKLIDVHKELTVTTENYFNIIFGDDHMLFPNYYVTEVHRDDITNELSITAYDAIYFLSKEPISATPPYTLMEFIDEAVSSSFRDKYNINTSATFFANLVNKEINYPDGGNFDDIDTARDGYNAAAEIMGGIYYIGKWSNSKDDIKDVIYFGAPRDSVRIEIDPEDYFSLKIGDNRRLKTVGHVTELGDNLIYDGKEVINTSGTTQYFRNNAFLELLEPSAVTSIMKTIAANRTGMTVAQFECEWRGYNTGVHFMSPGVKIIIHSKDGETIESYLYNDSITYDGALRHKMELFFDTLEEETYEANPISLGEALKKTYARVDKTNKVIELVASDNAENSEKISQLILDTQGISASVSSVQQSVNEQLEGINGNIETISKKVELAMTDEQVQIKIDKALDNGIDKVETSTGFTFDEVGLTVAKSGSEMKTTITEDGMHIYRDSTEVLIADNEGVWAEDLHATTYLIVGNSSRFEDYTNASGETRTGCFWIGG